MEDFLSHNLGLAFVLGGALTAFLSSVFFVGWGAIHGRFITNVSIDLKLKRTSHHLVIVIKIKKEDVNALKIEFLKVELFSLEQSSLDEKVAQWRTLHEQPFGKRRAGEIWVPQNRDNHSLNTGGQPYAERYVLAFWTPEYGRAENLAPSEATQYAAYSTIEPKDVYEVVVTLMGVRYLSRIATIFFGLWYGCFFCRYLPPKVYYTASAISVPPET